MLSSPDSCHYLSSSYLQYANFVSTQMMKKYNTYLLLISWMFSLGKPSKVKCLKVYRQYATTICTFIVCHIISTGILYHISISTSIKHQYLRNYHVNSVLQYQFYFLILISLISSIKVHTFLHHKYQCFLYSGVLSLKKTSISVISKLTVLTNIQFINDL